MLKKAFPYCLLITVAFIAPLYCCAQQMDTGSIFRLPISLDTFVLKSGFDVNAFIRRVQTDTTFYKAFKSTHLVPYGAVTDFHVFDKNGEVVATYDSKTEQVRDKGCRTTKVLEQKSTGDFFKRNGEYNYYTAGLFAHLFFATTPVCGENDIVAGSLNVRPEGQMAKSEYELKQLIFNPGSKVSGVPFMGDRASIFEQSEAEKYNFKVTVDTSGGQECYVFSITPKQGYEHSVIYDELITWFRKSDYSIVARNYTLSYHTMVYDFDVRMKVRTKQIGDKLYPTSIDYDGNWHVFTKKRERVKMSMVISYPQTP